MHIYFAPMEGLTDSIYRRLHHRYFGGVDRYYMPFFSPTVHHALTAREARELPRADGEPFPAVPQILTKSPGDFLWAAGQCECLGYGEVNLNLGCPSGTVVAKGKGAGMLADPDGLDRFLDEIFAKTPVPISIKNRLGVHSPEEFPVLLTIFNRYPIRELILHPRTRGEFYRGRVHMESFRYLVNNSKNPVCFNGNICCFSDIENFSKEFPTVEAVMVGRGLIGNPGMLSKQEPKTLEAFLNALLEEYTAAFGGSRNAMFRLKENWRYLACLFDGGDRLFKRLRKTVDVTEYRSLTHEILQTIPLRENLCPDW